MYNCEKGKAYIIRSELPTLQHQKRETPNFIVLYARTCGPVTKKESISRSGKKAKKILNVILCSYSKINRVGNSVRSYKVCEYVED